MESVTVELVGGPRCGDRVVMPVLVPRVEILSVSPHIGVRALHGIYEQRGGSTDFVWQGWA